VRVVVRLCLVLSLIKKKQCLSGVTGELCIWVVSKVGVHGWRLHVYANPKCALAGLNNAHIHSLHGCLERAWQN
jgi:hypothetical protein